MRSCDAAVPGVLQMFESNWLTLWALNVNYTTVELTPGDEIVVCAQRISPAPAHGVSGVRRPEPWLDYRPDTATVTPPRRSRCSVRIRACSAHAWHASMRPLHRAARALPLWWRQAWSRRHMPSHVVHDHIQRMPWIAPLYILGLTARHRELSREPATPRSQPRSPAAPDVPVCTLASARLTRARVHTGGSRRSVVHSSGSHS